MKKHQLVYKLVTALYRNRNAGHLRIAREFACSLDFLDLVSDAQPGLVVPGSDTSTVRRRPGEGLHHLARRVIQDTIDRGAQSTEGAPTGFTRILNYLEGIVSGLQSRRSRTPFASSSLLEELPSVHRHCDDLYRFALGRIDSSSDNMGTMTRVKSSIIGEPTMLADWTEPLRDHDRLRRAFASLLQAAKKFKACQFDRWLRNVREHRFLPLLGADCCRKLGKDEVAEQAQQIYCALLWLSYLGMARCYAALMLHVLVDLCLHSEVQPSEEERWLFLQRHFPRRHLGHLPLDFFGRHQLRWMIRTITPLLNLNVRQKEAYRAIPELLGLFGHMVRNRREADRRVKKQGSTRIHPRGDRSEIDEMIYRSWRRSKRAKAAEEYGE
jgi:hypothetical protein